MTGLYTKSFVIIPFVLVCGSYPIDSPATPGLLSLLVSRSQPGFALCGGGGVSHPGQGTNSAKKAIWFTTKGCYYERLPVTYSSVIEEYYQNKQSS